MTDRLVIGSRPRWSMTRPLDVHGDGYVHTMSVELADDGLTASGGAEFEGSKGENLRDFLAVLAANWRGWSGAKTWRSLEDRLAVEARHDGKGHVDLAVTLYRGWAPERWSARVVLTVEAGEELSRLARDADEFLRP